MVDRRAWQATEREGSSVERDQANRRTPTVGMGVLIPRTQSKNRSHTPKNVSRGTLSCYRAAKMPEILFSLLSNPWSFSPGADEEFTLRMRESFERGYDLGMQQGYAHGEVAGRGLLLHEFEELVRQRHDYLVTEDDCSKNRQPQDIVVSRGTNHKM